MSRQPQTPAARPKRAIEEAISPSPSPSLREPAKKKGGPNLHTGGIHGRPRKQAPVNMFDPIEYNPHGTPASTTSTASPTVAPKKATSRVSASSVPLIGGLSQAVEDTEDTEDSESAGGLGDTELESDVELSIEDD
ncbi:hypothetical protein V8E54_000740, partial [Elaphomyces granulatus]